MYKIAIFLLFINSDFLLQASQLSRPGTFPRDGWRRTDMKVMVGFIYCTQFSGIWNSPKNHVERQKFFNEVEKLSQSILCDNTVDDENYRSSYRNLYTRCKSVNFGMYQKMADVSIKSLANLYKIRIEYGCFPNKRKKEQVVEDNLMFLRASEVESARFKREKRFKDETLKNEGRYRTCS